VGQFIGVRHIQQHLAYLRNSSVPLTTKRNDVRIKDKPQNMTCLALPADTVYGGNQFAECNCLLLVFGFHAITISAEVYKGYGVFAL